MHIIGFNNACVVLTKCYVQNYIKCVQFVLFSLGIGWLHKAQNAVIHSIGVCEPTQPHTTIYMYTQQTYVQVWCALRLLTTRSLLNHEATINTLFLFQVCTHTCHQKKLPIQHRMSEFLSGNHDSVLTKEVSPNYKWTPKTALITDMIDHLSLRS